MLTNPKTCSSNVRLYLYAKTTFIADLADNNTLFLLNLAFLAMSVGEMFEKHVLLVFHFFSLYAIVRSHHPFLLFLVTYLPYLMAFVLQVIKKEIDLRRLFENSLNEKVLSYFEETADDYCSAKKVITFISFFLLMFCRTFLVNEPHTLVVLQSMSLVLAPVYFESTLCVVSLYVVCVTSLHIFARKFIAISDQLVYNPVNMTTIYMICIVPLIVCSLFVTVLLSFIRSMIRKLWETNKQVESHSKAKSVFLSTIGHEVRTPLNAIIGCADLLLLDKNGPLTPKQKENVETILACGNVLLETMNSILNFTKLEVSATNEVTRNQLVVKTSFGLKSLLREMIKLFKVQASEKGVLLHMNWTALDTNPDSELNCYSDVVGVRTVMNNLLSNACKFTSKGEVQVDVRQLDSKRVQIKVKDTGIGIDPKFADNIFKPFTQQDNTIHRSFGGTGLGLAITKHMVELLDGTITYESEMHKGTTFSVTLPIISETSSGVHIPIRRIEHHEGATEDFNSVNVLVVDDNSINIKVFDKMLCQLNVKHTNVRSGPDALEEFEKQNFHLVLLDIEMPIMSGLECARILRSKYKNKKFFLFFITGNERSSVDPQYMALVDGFVQKPLRLQTMQDILKNVRCAS